MSVALPSNFELAIRTAVGPPAVYTEIPGVVSFDEGGVAADRKDKSSFSSPNNRRQYGKGMRDYSEGSIVINYEPGNAQHEALRDAVDSDDTVFLRTIDDDQQMIMEVEILGCTRPRQVGEVRQMTVTFTITGDPVESVIT